MNREKIENLLSERRAIRVDCEGYNIYTYEIDGFNRGAFVGFKSDYSKLTFVFFNKKGEQSETLSTSYTLHFKSKEQALEDIKNLINEMKHDN